MSVTLLEKVAAVVMLAGLLAFIGWFAQHTWIKSMEEEEIPFIPAHVPLVRLDRPLRAVRRVEETESFNLVAGSQQNQEKSAAFGLAVACPFDQGNPSACPLHEIRKRNLKDRYEWIQGLSEERTHQLLAYHQECLDGKKSLKKNPPIAICFEAPRRSRGLVIESVIRKVG